jgi:hypothetical protein
MTANPADSADYNDHNDHTGDLGADEAAGRVRLVPNLYGQPAIMAPASPPPEAAVPEPLPPARPMPRLGRGIVWSQIVAEIEQDHQDRLRDAA